MSTITPNLRLRLEFEYFNKVGKEATTGESAVKNLALGIEYKF